MSNKQKLQEQRELWLRAIAARDMRVKERTDTLARLDRAVESAEERVKSERETLEKLVAQERDEANAFLGDVSKDEAAKAAEHMSEQEKKLQPVRPVQMGGEEKPAAPPPDSDKPKQPPVQDRRDGGHLGGGTVPVPDRSAGIGPVDRV